MVHSVRFQNGRPYRFKTYAVRFLVRRTFFGTLFVYRLSPYTKSINRTACEKWYTRTKNGTTLQTVRCSTFFGFSYLFAGKTVRRTFTWYTAYAFKTYDRTVSKRTLYAFWYAVRFSVAIVVPFIAAYKVYKSYTCSIFGMGGCFWYAYTVFRMRPFNGTLYCISYACTVFGIASVFGTHTVFGT